MTILLLDDDFITIEQLKCLTQVEQNWKIIKSDELTNNQIDLVIVDPFNEKYCKTLDDILQDNSTIRTITISDKLTSGYKKGCEYCDCNLNRVRLVKPLKVKLLYDTIKKFDEISQCPLMNAFDDLENLIPIILKQFKNLLYDQGSQTVSSNIDIDSKEYTMQILGLLTLLDQNEISYTLLEDSKIRINF